MSFANRLRSVISPALGLETIPNVLDANSTQTRASHKTIHMHTHHTIRDYIGYSTPCISGLRLVKPAPQCRNGCSCVCTSASKLRQRLRPRFRARLAEKRAHSKRPFILYFIRGGASAKSAYIRFRTVSSSI